MSIRKFDKFEMDPTVWRAVVAESADNEIYATSRTKEFNSLVNKGGFTLVSEQGAKGCRIYKSRFVDKITHAETSDKFAKWRLVVMKFNHKRHGLLTGKPTLQRSLQHLMLAVFGTFPDISMFLREIIQSYTQPKKKVGSPIYLSPSSIFNIPPGMLLRVDRPLYGLPDYSLHQLVTYHEHHRFRPAITAAVHDSCLLYIPACM